MSRNPLARLRLPDAELPIRALYLACNTVAMGLVSSWLRRWDRRNQIQMDALANIVHADRPGVVIISKPADPASDAWKTRNVVAIAGRTRSFYSGRRFTHSKPGHHILFFGIRGRLGRGTRARIEIEVPIKIEVPINGQVTVLYRPAMWPTGHATVEVRG